MKQNNTECRTENSTHFSSFKTSTLINDFNVSVYNSTNLIDKKEHSKERDIEFDGYLPKGWNNNASKYVLKHINDDLIKVWRSNTGIDAFDIDIKLEFHKDPEEGEYKVIYTVYVPNLTKKDIPIVWNNLRKLFNNTIKKNKSTHRKYRSLIEKLSEISYIQLDWD